MHARASLAVGGLAGLFLAACAGTDGRCEQGQSRSNAKSWLAGDHHIHSHYSVEWDKSVDPPVPVIGGEGKYSAELNARMARRHGLSWVVITDHGGPNQSKLNLERAYPDLVESREAVPDVIQFYGTELDTPGAKHSTVILPRTDDEADRLYQLENAHARKDAYPPDPARDTEPRMLEALTAMRDLPMQPVVIANHPGRSATDLGEYGLLTPRELRDWNDTAPTIVIGMEGSPGHQAIALGPDGSIGAGGRRGDYDRYPTMGGFDQMTARLGGFWDAMLGEGRRWWITSTSDSHQHYTEGGDDFWPGEYSKTYVYAGKSYDDILRSLRNGHVFVATGDLVTELYVTAETGGGDSPAFMGETLRVAPGSDVHITVKFLDPDGINARFENAAVARVDLITGLVTGALTDRTIDFNPTTRVAERFAPDSWRREGDYSIATYVLRDVTDNAYLRVRGTNGDEPEPKTDPPGEDPWSDLWFYGNPVFIVVD